MSNTFRASIFGLFFRSFILFLTSYSSYVHTTDPQSLWTAINTTLVTDKAEERSCVEVILYNEDTEKYVRPNYTALDSILINTNGNQPDGFMTDERVEEIRRKFYDSCPKWTKGIAVIPCIIVISIVDTRNETKHMRNETEDEIQYEKLKLSMAFTKLLQFRTPLNRRHLVLVRFGEYQDDFGQCRKSGPYLKYPRRLVPLWEQVLLDFFSSVRAIHVVAGKKTFDTRIEKGVFVWMCEDLINKLDEEDNCKANMTEVCAQKIMSGAFSAAGSTNCSSYLPVH